MFEFLLSLLPSSIFDMQEQQQDHFAILGVTYDATEAEIRKRYRVLSLQLHPDKSSLPPEEAAQRFDEVNKAYTYLQDPAVRLAMAQRSKAERAKAERRGAYEGKRKAMAEELERDEQEGAKRRRESGKLERERQEKIQRLKEQAKTMKENSERKVAASVEEEEVMSEEPELGEWCATAPLEEAHSHITSPPPHSGPLDLTVRLRFPSEQFDLLCAHSSPSTSAAANLKTRLGVALTSRFGQLQALLFTPAKIASSGKVSREASALATFETLDAAYAAVSDGSQLRGAGPPGSQSECLQDVHIAWAAAAKSKSTAAAQTGEPARVAWLRSQGLLASRPSATPSDHAPSPRGSPVHVQPSSQPPPSFSFVSHHLAANVSQ